MRFTWLAEYDQIDNDAYYLETRAWDYAHRSLDFQILERALLALEPEAQDLVGPEPYILVNCGCLHQDLEELWKHN
jgi:hypothetical protein